MAGEEVVYILDEPKLTNPVLLAAWPGIGQVALKAVSYLQQKLMAVEFAEIDPRPYFELGGVFIEDNLIQPPQFPQSKFFSWQNPSGGRDLLLFTSEAQPSLRGYEVAHRVLDVAVRFGAGEVYTLAAALVTELPQAPRVWGAVTQPQRGQELERYGVTLKGDFYIAGMNGLLLAVAQERNLEATCLLGETPRFAPQVENPAASLAVLEVLSALLGIPVDLTELQEEARKVRVELERLLIESRKEFIDRFTIPLWEQRDEEERA